MANRETIPLRNSDLEEHHCTVDLRKQKLRMSPFFRELSAVELTVIEKKFSAVHFVAGDNIYFQNERSTMMRVVMQGSIKIVRHTLESKKEPLDMLKLGEHFGYLFTSCNDSYTEVAQAQTGACIKPIRMRELHSLLVKYSEVAQSVLNIRADCLQSSQEQILHLRNTAG